MFKRKILIITRNLPPLIGGMERLNWHIADELSQQNEVLLLSHVEAKKQAPTQCKFYGVALNPLPIFLIFAFFKAFFICLSQKPDVIFAGSGLTAPIVVFWAKIFRKKSMVYIHGLDIATNHPIYNLIWIPLIRNANSVIANSSPTHDICIRKGIPGRKLSIIHPGVTYPPKPRNELLITSIKEQYDIKNKKILISVGRLTQRKGMKEFVDRCLLNITKEEPQTCLVIIGDTPTNSLNKNLQSKKEIIKTAKRLGIENHILFIGNITNDEILSSWYYLADIHIFPVKSIPEDPEGFGMVAIEAATHGTPTVAFKTGGIIDAINNEKTGFLIKNDDYDHFTKVTIEILHKKTNLNVDECKKFSKKFSWPILNKKFQKNIEYIK